ncbi:hypothetical protein [Microlunatus aurantiacus]|uniref:hypothetical protein n=1 Tax=Microlunatus aurantiacus TaxID=446786 RepID=UPI0031DB7C31
MTIVAVAVAWLLPVLTEPLSGTSRLVAALPGFAALGVAVLAVGIAYDVPGAEEVAYPLATFLNLLVVSGFAVLLGQVGTWPRHLVTALALSSMGFAGPIVNYLLMVHWSDLNWDAPPGSGYLTAAFLLVCGIAVLALTFLRRPAPPMAARRVPAEVAA